MVELTPDFDEFFGSLIAHGVEWGNETARGGSRDLPFIGRAEFIRNKRAAGRLKDLADVEALEG